MSEHEEHEAELNGEPTPPSGEPAVPPMSPAIYDRAVWRMQRVMLATGVVVVAIAGWRLGWPGAAGALIGAALSCHNFRWLTQAVNALGERITTGHSRERGGLIVLRFTGRLLLMAGGCYAIFKCSLVGLYGYLAGLSAPVPALFGEAAYELFIAYRRGL